MCAVDGATNYEKAFRLFGPPQVDVKNTTTISDIHNEFRKDGREEAFDQLENQIRASSAAIALPENEVESELVSLEALWDDSDEALPRRIRCFVHLLVLIPKIDFGIGPRGLRNTRQVEFWDHNPHAEFKSKYTIISNI